MPETELNQTTSEEVIPGDQNSNEVPVSQEEQDLLDKMFGQEEVITKDEAPEIVAEENKDVVQTKEEPSYPVQRDDEPSSAYDARLRIWHLTNGKNSAETPEEEEFFKAKLKEERKALKEISYKENLEKTQSSVTEEVAPSTGYTDQDLKEVEDVLTAKLGLVKKDDVKEMIAELLGQSAKQNNQKEVAGIMKDFYSKNSIFSNKEVRSVFESYVDNTFNVSSRMTDKNITKELPAYLKFANEQLFGSTKPDTTKVREANDKANIAGITSSGVGKTTYKYTPVGATDDEISQWAALGLLE